MKQYAMNEVLRPCPETVILQKATMPSVSFYTNAQALIPLQLLEIFHGDDRVIGRSQDEQGHGQFGKPPAGEGVSPEIFLP